MSPSPMMLKQYHCRLGSVLIYQITVIRRIKGAGTLFDLVYILNDFIKAPLAKTLLSKI